MKTKKFNLQWQSILIGMALCLLLVVFVAGKAQSNPVDGSQRVLQRPANLNDVWEKSAALEAKLIAMEDRLVRMDQKLDILQTEMRSALKTLDKMWNRNYQK